METMPAILHNDLHKVPATRSVLRFEKLQKYRGSFDVNQVKLLLYIPYGFSDYSAKRTKCKGEEEDARCTENF